jgi:uncharacterized OsmC-like protein
MTTDEHVILNGIDVTEFDDALRQVAAQPAAARAPKTSRVRWMGGMKLKVGVRNHSFVVDEPPHLKGDDTAPNAVEYVLGAYGACLATGFILNATKRGIEIRNLEIALDSTQDNAFSFLGINDDGHSGLDNVRAKLYIQADADEATLLDVWNHTLRTSPVGNSLTRIVNVTPEIAVFP